MANPTTIPDLPVEFLSSDDALVGYFQGVGLKAHADLVEAAAKFETIREAESKSQSALEESTDPAAVAYRQAKEDTETSVEAIKAARDKELDEVRKRYNASIKDASDALKEQEKNTLKKIAVELVADIDVTSVVTGYSTALQGMKGLAVTLKDNCPELLAYFKSLPSDKAQANGGGQNTGASRNWTPRLISATVTHPDNTVTVCDPSTLGQVAKIAGGNRIFHAHQLQGAIGSPDNLSTDPENPSVYTFTKNNETWTVSVVGRAKGEDD
jgi:hypothetical protein